MALSVQQMQHLTGSISETAVVLDLLRYGFNVLTPAVVSRYDLLAEVGDKKFVRIQVKTARVDTRDGNLKATWDTPYSQNEVDLIAVYDPSASKVYYIPIEDIPSGAKGITIRVTPYKQNRSSTAFKAKDYSRFPFERVIQQ